MTDKEIIDNYNYLRYPFDTSVQVSVPVEHLRRILVGQILNSHQEESFNAVMDSLAGTKIDWGVSNEH